MRVTSSPEPVSAEAESSQLAGSPEQPSCGPPLASPQVASSGTEGEHREEWTQISAVVGISHRAPSPSTTALMKTIAAVGDEQETVVKASIANLTSVVDLHMADQTRRMHDIFNATAATQWAGLALPNALVDSLASVQQTIARMALPAMPMIPALTAMVSDTNRILTSPAILDVARTVADLSSIRQYHTMAVADSLGPVIARFASYVSLQESALLRSFSARSASSRKLKGLQREPAGLSLCCAGVDPWVRGEATVSASDDCS
ncbi:hypothetical protein OS965_40355, partial [Streptomyces sp. H27-G5]|uniref:hypothetical protein n=1 Tax=Streptomyces sp. H27-G5 TaxID=2996698 RepID=UPI002270C1DE